ncbi:MAG: hypothetical protein FWE40_05320 [Oscillospiraceae bacterium]|nr:hypothetical protein [Oscillospiraceae bacterium]
MTSEMMSVQEFARTMGKGADWAIRVLREDAKLFAETGQRNYPFAVPTKSEQTGAWDYAIARSRFERWLSGDDIAMQGLDIDALASSIAAQTVRSMALRMAGKDDLLCGS